MISFSHREVITLEIYERIRKVRETFGLTRAQFAERLGVSASEITNVEFNKIKRPESKESLYRSIAAEFGVALDWIKSGAGDMFGAAERDETLEAFGELAARKDPIIDGFVLFLQSRTPEQLELIAEQIEACADFLRKDKKETG